MTTTSKVIIGILGAAAAGVILGVLIAPEKGEDLRKNIKKTADDWMGDIAQWMGKGKKYLAEMKDQAEEEAAAATEQIKEARRRSSSSVSHN